MEWLTLGTWHSDLNVWPGSKQINLISAKSFLRCFIYVMTIHEVVAPGHNKTCANYDIVTGKNVECWPLKKLGRTG